MDTGRVIEKALKEKGLKKKWLSEKTDISQTALSKKLKTNFWTVPQKYMIQDLLNIDLGVKL